MIYMLESEIDEDDEQLDEFLSRLGKVVDDSLKEFDTNSSIRSLFKKIQEE